MAVRISLALLLTGMTLLAQTPTGYWPPEKAREILDKTRTIRLAPEGANLTAGERLAIARLVEVGKIFQSIYEDQLHPQARQVQPTLEALKPARPDLVSIYRLSRGPIATTLDNKREAFVPAPPETAGKNVYPAGLTKDDIERFLKTHPEKRDSLLHSRTVVRRATAESLRADLATFDPITSLWGSNRIQPKTSVKADTASVVF